MNTTPVSSTATTLPLRAVPTPGAAAPPSVSPSSGNSGQCLALLIPSDEGELTAAAMENFFQACSSDDCFSLELVGTKREQGFVLRASSEVQYNLLCKQLEAQYPQCDIQRIAPSADPLLLQEGEHAIVGEFGLLQDSWAPIKTFSGDALSEPGADPLLGLLAAMESIGSGMRIIAQLALVRAPEQWLRADIRKSVEHPLQHERDQLMTQAKGTAPSDTAQGVRLIGLIGLIVGALLTYRAVQAHAWLPIGIVVAVALVAGVGYLWWMLGRNAHPIYDMKLVAEKMAKAGFYCQLRVMVIGEEPLVPPEREDTAREALLHQLEQQRLALHQEMDTIRTRVRTLQDQKNQTPRTDLPVRAHLDHQCHMLKTRLATHRQTDKHLAKQMRAERRHLAVRTKAREQRHQEAIAEQQQRYTEHLTALEVAYRQYTMASANGFALNRIRPVRASDSAAAKLPTLSEAFTSTHWFLRLLHAGAFSKWVLNSLELAGLFHLPQEIADIPLVRRRSGRRLLASPEIAHQIQHTPAPQSPALVGYSRHRRYSIPVLLPFDALFSNKAIFGMSRTGKTVLMQLLTWAAMQKVRDRRTPQPGVFCIDPHRDFIMDLLLIIAGDQDLASRVVLLDMTDTQYPVALNPLDASMGFTRDQAVSNLMSSFQKIWAEFWGPRMSYFLNAVCLLLYTLNQKLVAEGKADQQYTLLDINPLLQYKDYALKVLTQLDMSETWHQVLLAWWKNTYFTLPTNSSFRQEVIMPILSKIGVFNDNEQLRHIVGQSVTKAPVHLAVTEGKIVLCALSAKDMSDDAVNILGSTVVNLLHRAFSVQQPIPLLQRRKVFCALDEFHVFSGSDFDKMLSEDAKLGCSMLLATQNLTRLNKIRDGLMEMVFSTCPQLFVFRVSAGDAVLLEEELEKKVTPKHIISQPALHAYCRLTLAGYPTQITSTHLARPINWGENPHQVRLADDLRQHWRMQNLSVDEVERRYERHLRQFLDITEYAEKIRREVRASEQNRQQRAAVAQGATVSHTMPLDITTPLATLFQTGETAQPNTRPPIPPIPIHKSSRKHRHNRSRRQGKPASGPDETLQTPDLSSDGGGLRPPPPVPGKGWQTSRRERQE